MSSLLRLTSGAIIGALLVYVGYLEGWNHGWTLGYKTGQADKLMESIGKIIRHRVEGPKDGG